uniref:F-box domain-containing protein n=1 Tax=Aegilops tauschii TaxID=37682 RepID=M8BA19_AEGTA
MVTTKKETASLLTEIPDELLAEIFLRLSDPADLARASVARVSFRRLVTDGSFLASFRSHHTPLILALLDRDGFHPALPPHPSAAAARTLALAVDFTFSFLPGHFRWFNLDIRDGRVLLQPGFEEYGPPGVFRELAVCDPLHRRYALLPQLPDDLAATVDCLLTSPFLVPVSEDEEETAFKVICLARGKTKVAAFVFSSSIGQWQAAACMGWSDLALDMVDSDMMSRTNSCYLRRHYAYGCFYWDWLVIHKKQLLVLDTRRMEFSIADLPPGGWCTHAVAIVEAGEGRLGLFGHHGETASDLTYAVVQNRGESPSQCQIEKTVSLDSGYRCYIKAVTESCLLLMRTEALPGSPLLIEYFTTDIKTLQLRRVSAKECKTWLPGIMIYAHLFETGVYTNFPPSLLPPRTV